MIRCYECKYYKQRNNYKGKCQNPKFEKIVPVDAVDFCEYAEKKEAED